MEPNPERIVSEPPEELEKPSIRDNLTSTVILCASCNKEFSSKGNLNKHYKKVHALDTVEDSCGTIHCLEQHCKFTSRYISGLRKHLVSIHGFKMDEEEVTFQSLEGTIYVITYISLTWPDRALIN